MKKKMKKINFSKKTLLKNTTTKNCKMIYKKNNKI